MVNIEEMMQFPSGGIYSSVISKSSKHSITLMCLSKGSDIDTHTSTRQGFVYVLKGKGAFRLFNDDITMKPGVLIEMPKDAPHSLKADEDTAILLTLIE